MAKSNINVEYVLANIQKTIQINSIDLRTWEKFFLFYLESSNKMLLDLQSLIELNNILLEATITDIVTTEYEVRFKVAVEFLKKDLSKLTKSLNYLNNMFDDNGFLKPEWVMTYKEKNKLMFNDKNKFYKTYLEDGILPGETILQDDIIKPKDVKF